MISKLRGPLRRVYEMQPIPGVYHNLLLQPEEAAEDIPDYIVWSAVAASVGVLLLVLGILLMVLDGFSFLNLVHFLPVFPGTVAIIHSLRVKRCLNAGDTAEARRASNYAETWARISLFTFAGMVVSGVLWLIALTIVVILLVILAIVAVIVLLILTVVLLRSFSGDSDDSNGSGSSGSGWLDGGDSRDSDRTFSGGAAAAGAAAERRRRQGGGRRGR